MCTFRLLVVRNLGLVSGQSHKSYNFQERVKAFTLDDFLNMFNQSGIVLLDVFGDYKLNKYKRYESERLIMIFM